MEVLPSCEIHLITVRVRINDVDTLHDSVHDIQDPVVVLKHWNKDLYKNTSNINRNVLKQKNVTVYKKDIEQQLSMDIPFCVFFMASLHGSILSSDFSIMCDVKSASGSSLR